MKPTSYSPSCEIVTIGSELLLGQITDTNTTYLAQELGKIGVTISFRTAVGDRMEEIVTVIRSAIDRCDMVMTTGGLGPTQDDLTREAVARVVEVELEFRQDLMDQIAQFFRRIGFQMSENNRRQAFVPAGSKAISNPVGTAPAFISEVNAKPIICLPGVPRELKYLLNREVLPWLQRRFDLADHRVTYKVLKVVGTGESAVDHEIGDLMGPEKNPEIGLLSSPGEIKIRITATAVGERQAQALIHPVEMEIRSRLGKKVYGENNDTLEGVIDSLLVQQGLTLAILETFTAGLVGHRLHRLPCSQLVESRVIPDRRLLNDVMGWHDIALGPEATRSVARMIKETWKSDVGLAIVGFPDDTNEDSALAANAAAIGQGIENSFSWQMSGKPDILQERGAVTGLNTLRLALLSES